MEQIRTWLQANKLSLNVSKTQYIIFTTNKRNVPDLDIKIDGVKIDRVYSTKFLGVQIDSKLHWHLHVNYISKKLSKCTGILYKAKKILNSDSLRNLYNTLAYPYLIYCNLVWGNTYQIHLNKLLKIQKKFLRLINNNKDEQDSKLLFKKFKLLDINQIYFYLVSIFMYKYMLNILPSNFDGMFRHLSQNHEYSTRQINDLIIPVCRFDISRRSIRNQGVVVWNQIYNIALLFNSLDLFKKNIKNCLIYDLL